MRLTYYLIIFFAALQLRAQDTLPRWFLGVVGGYNANYQRNTFIVPYWNGATVFLPETGNSSIWGLAGEYRLNGEGRNAIQLKTYYERVPGNFSWDTESSNGNFGNYSVQTNYDFIYFDILYKYDIPFLSHTGLCLGPQIGFVTGTRYVVFGDEGNIYSAIDRQMPPSIIADNSIPNAFKFQAGIKFGIQYEWMIHRFLITPVVSYNYGITNIAPGWHVNTLAGTVDVKYGL
ncbi:MAG TPA: hypothetical protein VFJ29_05695 [Candidatus Kapabacteria bacterium]|nr:hypothetical protein [Candidatus Kapabacteria bacterium]